MLTVVASSHSPMRHATCLAPWHRLPFSHLASFSQTSWSCRIHSYDRNIQMMQTKWYIGYKSYEQWELISKIPSSSGNRNSSCNMFLLYGRYDLMRPLSWCGSSSPLVGVVDLFLIRPSLKITDTNIGPRQISLFKSGIISPFSVAFANCEYIDDEPVKLCRWSCAGGAVPVELCRWSCVGEAVPVELCRWSSAGGALPVDSELSNIDTYAFLELPRKNPYAK